MQTGNLTGTNGTNRPPRRTPAQRDRILALLREWGSGGVTNFELSTLCLRYGARIFELRRQGESLFRFGLVAEPQVPKSVPTFTRHRAPEQSELPLFAEARP